MLTTQPPLSVHFAISRHYFCLLHHLLFDDVFLKQCPSVTAAVFCCVLSCGKVYAWPKYPPVNELFTYNGMLFYCAGPIEEGPTQQELLELLQQCEISQSRSSSAMSSRMPSPSPSLISLVYPNLKQLHNTGSSSSSISHQVVPKQSLSTLQHSLSSHSVNTVCDATSFQAPSRLTKQASIHSHVLSIKQKDDLQETMVNFEMKVENTSISSQNRTHMLLNRTESDGSVVSSREKHHKPTVGRSASSTGRPTSRTSVNSGSNSTTPHTSRPGSSTGPRSSDYFSLCYQEDGLSFDC